MESRRVDIGDLGVAVIEAGAGGRPLLLVHGWTGAKEDFADHLDDLAALGYHAVAPDLRGHGSSDKPTDESSYSLEILAADQLALADALGWGPFTLLGHSMGGMATQVLVLKDPDRVDALVLMATSPGPVEGIDIELLKFGIAVAREQGVDLIADILAEADSPLTTPAGKRLQEERPGYKAMGDRNLRASAPAMYAALGTLMYAQDHRLDRLHELTMPTLVLVGDQDKPFLGVSRKMAEVIPDARLVVIPEAGHSPQFENPAAWFAALTEFLGETAPTPS